MPRNLAGSERDNNIYREISAIVTLPNGSEMFYGVDKKPIKADELGKKFGEYWGAMETLSNDTKIVYVVADASINYETLVKIFASARKERLYTIRFVVSPNDKTEANNILETILPKEVKTDIPQKPNPLMLVAALQKDGKIKLNNEDNTLDSLKARLAEVFRNRQENGVFREGTNETEKTVTIKAFRSAKYEEIAKLINALKEVGASPIILQIDDLSD